MKHVPVFRTLFTAGLLALLVLVPALPGVADAKRVALVIGNAAYQHTLTLDNPLNDARGVTASLKRLGFSVTPLLNADKGSLEQQLRSFRRQSRGAELALLYYAGHAVQIEGRNYLVPVDAEVRELGDISLYLVTLNTALQQMEGQINLVILDACRNNPFEEDLKRSAERLGRTLGATRGLAREEAFLNEGSYLMMAAGPGRVAADGPRGGNSPYTAALLQHLERPDLELRMLAAEVRAAVEAQTSRQQTPEAIDRLPPRHIYLASSGVITTPPAAQTTLKVTSNISGARVLVDGRSIGTVPIDSHALAPGSYTIRVERDGYETFEQRITIASGRMASVNALLNPVRPRAASLRVNTTPGAAQVRILNIRPPYTPGIELAPGAYHIEVTAAGHEMYREWIEVGAGEDKILAVSLIQTRVDPPAQPPAPQPTPSAALRAGSKQAVTVKGLTFNMVYIPAGEYLRGSPSNEPGRLADRESPQHRVQISKGFWMGETEVTQGLWQAVMGNNPSRFKACGSTCPVESVSWNDSQEFIKRLNGLVSGGGFRLPTEAEWEYAARAGTTGPYAGDLNAMGWYSQNSGSKTHPVARKNPNAWDLYDMHGNVWEWAQDWFGSYPSGLVTDPTGPSSGALRVLRGGSWYSGARNCRSAGRSRNAPDNRDNHLGLRLARTH